MNKVFSISQNGTEEEGRKIIENAKQVFINFFGKKYEGRICSNLDYCDYIYFGNGQKGKVKRIVFAYDFFDSDLGQYVKEKFSSLEAKRIRGFLADLIHGENCCQAAACLSNLNKKRLENISFLPTEAANRVYLHEMLHIISLNIISKDGRNKKRVKHGFRIKNLGSGFNEVFTEYLACMIDKYMKDNNLPLLTDGNSPKSTYSYFFGFLAPFIEKHYDVLVQSYFGYDLSACYETFGKDNFDKILKELDTMLKKEIFESRALNDYLLAAEEYAQNNEERQNS